MKIKKNMKQWEVFFEGLESYNIEAGLFQRRKSFLVEELYQNFKKRLLDDLSKEMERELRKVKKENNNGN